MKNIFLIFIFMAFGICRPAFSNENATAFAYGADVSWLTQMEASGRKFYNASGEQMECMSLLKSIGFNSIRLRVWVNPANGWCNTQDLLVKALRAHNLGMRIMVDFHYSDTWADPGKQTKPAAWTNLSFADLKTAVASHTTEVLNTLKSNGITPEWVQVGNETGNGMLWNDGKASVNMANYAALNNAGYDAVKSVFPNAKVVVHIQNGQDNSLFRWIFDGLKNNGGKWDVIGMSLYPNWYKTPNDWQNANKDCLANMNDMVSRYNKEVMIVECGMSWDMASASKAFLTDLIAKTKSVNGSKGTGVMYWEPQSYNNWQGYTLGAFENANIPSVLYAGRPTIALDAFKNPAASVNPAIIAQPFRHDRENQVIYFDEEMHSIEIISPRGEIIKSNSASKSISTHGIPRGFYMVRINNMKTNHVYGYKIIL